MAAAVPLAAARCHDPRTDSVEALDSRLRQLVKSAAPVRLALARIARRLVEDRGWEGLGFARPADYARERPGLSARELRELASVGAALARLPRIEAAFATGRLGWTQVRLLCRAATAEDEAQWLEASSRLSAGALARGVRAIDVGSVEAGGAEPYSDEDGERETLRVRTPRRVLAKWGHVRRTLRQVTGEWLPAEACVEFVAAEVLSAIRLESEPEAPPPVTRRSRAPDAEPSPAGMEEAAAEPPVAPFVVALAEGLDAAGPRDLDARLCHAATLDQGLLAQIGPLLLELADARGHHEFGFRSLDAYARDRLGISPRKARALLRLERACGVVPALARAWRAGRVQWCQAQALVPLVLARGSFKWHAGWIDRAEQVTVRRLEDDVEHALASGALDPALLPALPEGVQIGAEHTGREETEVWRANVPAEVGRLFRACLCTVARQLGSSPGAALEAMFDHCTAAWWRNAPREHRVFARDGWRCTVPGCTTQRNLHAHHVLFRSAGGGDDLVNLVTLCAAHHQRGVHTGLIRIRGRAPGALVFEMPLGRFASGDLRIGGTAR